MTFIGKVKKVERKEPKEGEEEGEVIETEEEKEVEVFDVVYKVLNLVLELGQSSNLSVKKTVLYKMFPLFVNNALSFCGRKHSNAYLTMLKNAHAIEWPVEQKHLRDKETKEHLEVLGLH